MKTYEKPKITDAERREIEAEVAEQSRRIVFGERGRRAVNPKHESERIVRR